MCFNFILRVVLKHFSFFEELSDILSYMCMGLHVKYPKVCLILMTLKFFEKMLEYQVTNLMQIRPVGAELFHTDGGTDEGQLIDAFRNCGNTPKLIFSDSIFYYLKRAKSCKVSLKAVSGKKLKRRPTVDSLQ